MKKIIAIGIVLCCMANLLTAQSPQLKDGTYYVKLKTIDGEKVKGKLVSIEDRQVTLLPKGWDRTENFEVQEIKQIRIRKKGAAGVGALAGGLTLGLLGGLAQGDANGQVEQGINAAETVGFALLGILGGAIIGGAYRKYTIKGDLVKFEKFKKRYLKKSKSSSEK